MTEEIVTPALITMQEVLARLPEIEAQFPSANIHILCLAATDDRRIEMNNAINLGGPKFLTYQYDAKHRASVTTMVYPFEHHSVAMFRGRTRCMIVLDSAIADEYLAYSKDCCNHHRALDLSLKSVADFLGIDSKQLYFKF